MPSYKEAFPSKWLKPEDCPLILEIKSVGFEDVGSGTDVQRKLVLRFVERSEGLPLNQTNCRMLESLLGTDDYDQWVGARIYLVSRKVMFKEKLVNGIRIEPMPTRKSRPVTPRPTPPAAAPVASTAPVSDDSDFEEPDTEIEA